MLPVLHLHSNWVFVWFSRFGAVKYTRKSPPVSFEWRPAHCGSPQKSQFLNSEVLFAADSKPHQMSDFLVQIGGQTKGDCSKCTCVYCCLYSVMSPDSRLKENQKKALWRAKKVNFGACGHRKSQRDHIYSHKNNSSYQKLKLWSVFSLEICYWSKHSEKLWIVVNPIQT